MPSLVPKQDLNAAIAANSVGVNISRALGPALGGVIIGVLGIAAPFWINAISNLAVIGGALVTSQGINVQTGTSYTVLTTDAGALIEFNNGGSIAVSVPSAAATGFTSGFAFDVQNLNVGMITLTPAAKTRN